MRFLLLFTVALVLAACGGGGAEQDQPGTTAPEQTTPAARPPDATSPDAASPTAAEPRELTGTLGGDPQLEGGCVWLDSDAGRVEVIWPAGYEASTEPIRLVGPDGEVVAEEGDEVTIVGREDPERMSVCQVGPIWAADEVTAGQATG